MKDFMITVTLICKTTKIYWMILNKRLKNCTLLELRLILWQQLVNLLFRHLTLYSLKQRLGRIFMLPHKVLCNKMSQSSLHDEKSPAPQIDEQAVLLKLFCLS